MKLIKSSFEIIEQEIPVNKIDDYSGEHFREEYINNMYKHIEKCARICYKSEHRITESSYKSFVKRLIDSKHYSTLEHGAVYLKVLLNNDLIIEDAYGENNSVSAYNRYLNNKYSKVYWKAGLENVVVTDAVEPDYAYITTNYRVIIENHWEDDLQYLCEPTEYHEKRHTVLLHSCVHTYKDLTRHRHMSFSIESTRFVNYSNTDKFGEMKFVIPSWLNLEEGSYSNGKYLTELGEKYINASKDVQRFLLILQGTELDYNEFIELGWQPQQAAEILPQCTAADVVMSGFSSDWEFVFKLRTSYIHATGMPHPLVSEIMNPIYDEFIKRNYIHNLI